MSEELITPEEAVDVLEEAIDLIKEPASWTTGKWKCELYETDKNGKAVLDADGNARRKVDLFNRPQFQYCVEGAVNQAVYNVLGEERATALGAYRKGWTEENEAFSSRGRDTWPTDILGIDELARLRHVEFVGGESHAALSLNDSYLGKDHKEGHKRILDLLKERKTQIKKSLSKSAA